MMGKMTSMRDGTRRYMMRIRRGKAIAEKQFARYCDNYSDDEMISDPQKDDCIPIEVMVSDRVHRWFALHDGREWRII